MIKNFGQSDPKLAGHVHDVYRPEDDVLAEIRSRSTAAGLPEISLSAMDGRHLEILTALVRPRRCVEIGTLGGYSGVCILRGATEDAVLHTFELEEHHATVARESFERAGFADRVRVHVGAAVDGLPEIESEGPFDLVFIDADKVSYPLYLAWAEDNLRPGGLVIADNAFLFGKLADEPAGEDAEAITAMRSVHERLADRSRFLGTVIPTGEGLAIGMKVTS